MAKTAISALQEYLQKTRAAAPCYTEIALGHVDVPTFKVRCECMGLSADGEASNKKSAKHRAAGKMIKLIEEKYNYSIFYADANTSALTSPASKSIVSSTPIAIPTSPAPIINHIGKLNEMCASRKMHQPVYHDTQCSGPSHIPIFEVECKIGKLSVSRTAHTKKQAKQEAAGAMRDLLRENYTIFDDIETVSPATEQASKAAEEIEIKIKDLQIQEDPKLATATDKAKSLYPALKKRLGVVKESPKNISIADYHEAFKASFDPKTIECFLQYYKSLKMTEKLSRITLEGIFQKIIEILGITFETRSLKVIQTAVYIVVYKIKSNPSFTEVGMGDNPEIAHVDALHRLIGAIYLMLV